MFEVTFLPRASWLHDKIHARVNTVLHLRSVNTGYPDALHRQNTALTRGNNLEHEKKYYLRLSSLSFVWYL